MIGWIGLNPSPFTIRERVMKPKLQRTQLLCISSIIEHIVRMKISLPNFWVDGIESIPFTIREILMKPKL